LNRALFTLLVCASASALACPVCGVAATEEGQEAYKTMSIIISLVPLVAIGSIVAWVASRIKAAAREDARALASTSNQQAP
jgi:hypothetical protein